MEMGRYLVEGLLTVRNKQYNIIKKFYAFFVQILRVATGSQSKVTIINKNM